MEPKQLPEIFIGPGLLVDLVYEGPGAMCPHCRAAAHERHAA